jgi:hypothetical protein
MFTLLFVHRSDQLLQKISSFRIAQKLDIDSAVIIQNTTRRLPMRKQKP